MKNAGQHAARYASRLSSRPRRGKLFLRATFLAAALLLATAGCPHLLRPQVETRTVPAPGPSGSFGELGVFVAVDELARESATLSVPIPADELRWFQADSLRLARWQPESETYELLSDPSFDTRARTLQATISEPGTYGVFALSRIPHIRDFQNGLCEGRFERPALAGEFPERICQVILCPAFDARAWSRSMSETPSMSGPGGMPIEPAAIGEHLGNVCDQCFGRPGGLIPPECGIIVEPPATPPAPPELEELRVGIAAGGRAVAIAVDPDDDDNILVASETGGLFRSGNRGDTWQHVSADITFDFTDVQYFPSDTDIAVATARRDTKVASGGGIYRSDDGGDSWSQVAVTPPDPACVDDFAAYALDYEAARDRLWAATSCGVAFSPDAGVTWDFLPTTANYANDDTQSIATPDDGEIKIVTGTTLKVTTDDGASWTPAGAVGLPASRLSGVHNQLAVSPRNDEHLYWAFRYRDDGKKRGLYLSTDNGASWTQLVEQGGWNRLPTIRIAESLSGDPDQYDLYFGNGSCYFGRATATHGATPTVSAWTQLTIDHCDTSDVAFANDGKTPLLLASDGGLHETTDDGATWTMTGAGPDGYNALQITEVTGQKHAVGPGSDLYFGTQDNDVWGSPDFGATWPNKRCCEGFYLGVPHEHFPAADTRVSGVTCGACNDFIAEPVLTNQGGFPFSLEHPDENFAFAAAAAGDIRDATNTVVGEAGTDSQDQPDRDTWHTVTLANTYASPVVVAQLTTIGGTEPAHVRLRNVAPNSFEFQIEEWEYQNGSHNTETIDYLVVESGRHVLSGGGVLEAGTVTANETWTTVPFASPYAARPAVVSHVQTRAGGDPVTTRHTNLALGGFDLRVQEEGGRNGITANETVGWIAGTSGTTVELSRAAALIDQDWSTHSFGLGFAAPPVVVASLETFNGAHTPDLRLRNTSASDFEIRIQDEMSLDGNPKLVKHQHYLKRTRPDGLNVYHLSDDNAATWAPRYSFTDPVMGFPDVAGPESDPTVFTAVRAPGTTPTGGQQIGLKRIVGVLGSGSPFASDVTGFGSLGTFPTMFAWYETFAVHPDDPNTLMVPDVIDKAVKVTTNGGLVWDPDTELTDLVTDSGRFRFTWRRGNAHILQVDTLAYDPDCDGHIMVGTRQAGIFQSFDDGANWERIDGTQVIPRVSSFYYAGNGQTIVSSYGRGLWRVRYDCPTGGGFVLPPWIPPPGFFPRPIIFWKGIVWPLGDIDPDSCPACRYYLIESGDIVGVRIDQDGQLVEVSTSGGDLRAFDVRRQAVERMLEVRQAKGESSAFGDKGLTAFLTEGNYVKGLVVEDGRLRGYVVANEDVQPETLPAPKPERAQIHLGLSTTRGIGIGELGTIEIAGTGFDPSYPVEVSLDGVEVAEAKEARVDAEGRFVLEIRPMLNVGGHSIRAWQETERGVVEDVVVFNVTVEDFPEGRKEWAEQEQ